MQLREKIKKELISLCTGELAAVISFWFCLWGVLEESGLLMVVFLINIPKI